MNDMDTIRLGYGLGHLCFGSTVEECRKYLGDPEEEEIEPTEDEDYIVWHYWSKGISIYFEESEGERLGVISTERQSATLNGERLIGKTVEEIEAWLDKKGYPYLNESDSEGEAGDRYGFIEVDEIQCHFLFTNNILEAIQWGYLWIDEETPKWPKRVTL